MFATCSGNLEVLQDACLDQVPPILCWKDIWMGDEAFMQIFLTLFSFALHPDISLADIMCDMDANSGFSLPLPVQTYDELQHVKAIINNNLEALVPGHSQDVWTYVLKKGVHSVASFYKLLFDGIQVDPIFPKIWKSECFSKPKVFAWLLIMDRLNTIH